MTPRCKPPTWPHPPQTAHAGLWLDKYIGEQKKAKDASADESEVKKKKPKALLVDQVACLGEAPDYADFFARWRLTLDAWRAARKDENLLLAQAVVRGRMIVGLGAESVLETSITLHRAYGTPYIPGSALKGLARSYALHHLDASHWGRDSDALKIMFGETPKPQGQRRGEEEAELPGASFGAGFVTFFDALYMPGTGVDGYPLRSDVLTPHHQAYYSGAEIPPADWDSPTPIPFLTATGIYLIALGGPGDWPLAAYQILEKACAELGVGAKTSSGYGRLALSRHLAAPKQQMAARVITPRAESRTVVAPSATPLPKSAKVSIAQPTLYTNAAPLPAGATEPVPSVTSGAEEWRSGKVLKYAPYNGEGVLEDEATHQQVRFTKAQLAETGWMPRQNLSVEYTVDKDRSGYAAAVRHTPDPA